MRVMSVWIERVIGAFTFWSMAMRSCCCVSASSSHVCLVKVCVAVGTGVCGEETCVCILVFLLLLDKLGVLGSFL